MNKKLIKRIFLSLFWTAILVGLCIFPYPALFMANSVPKQPELSVSEKRYFDRLKRKQPWSKISRMYCNIDSLGRDIWIRNIPIDFNSRYVYYISLKTQDTACYYANNTQEYAFTIARYIRDSVCFSSPYLFGIEVDINYRDTVENSGNGRYEVYIFHIQRDSIQFKKEMSPILWGEEKE